MKNFLSKKYTTLNKKRNDFGTSITLYDMLCWHLRKPASSPPHGSTMTLQLLALRCKSRKKNTNPTKLVMAESLDQRQELI